MLSTVLLLLAGCGFKSDLFLPQDQVIQSRPSEPVESTSMPDQREPGLDAQASDIPGVAVEIPLLEDLQRTKKKDK